MGWRTCVTPCMSWVNEEVSGYMGLCYKVDPPESDLYGDTYCLTLWEVFLAKLGQAWQFIVLDFLCFLSTFQHYVPKITEFGGCLYNKSRVLAPGLVYDAVSTITHDWHICSCNMSFSLSAFIACFVLLCWRLAKDDRNEREWPENWAVHSPGRLGRLKAYFSSKAEQPNSMGDSAVHKRGPWNLDSSEFSETERSGVEGDADAGAYVTDGTFKIATEHIMAGLRKALRMIAIREKEYPVSVVTEDTPGVRVYDSKSMDTFPPEVIDALLCIDRDCDHDHSRYRWKGSYLLVGPKTNLDGASQESTHETKDVEDGSDLLSTKLCSPGEASFDEGYMHGSLDSSPKRPATGEASGAAFRQEYVTCDWRAPTMFPDCPYCNNSRTSDAGSTTSQEPRSSPIAKSMASPSPVPGCSYQLQDMRVVLEEDLMEESIGPPQANSSFQEEKENNPIRSSPDMYRGGASASGVARHPPTKLALSDIPGGCLNESSGMRSGTGSPRPRWSPKSELNKCRIDDSLLAAPRELFVSPHRSPECSLSSADGAGSMFHEENRFPDLADNELPFHECEMSVTDRSQRTMDESRTSADLAELSRSLSFYGDVSVLEVAATWIVSNILERVSRNIHTSVRRTTTLQESFADLSASISDAIGYFE